MQMLLFWIEQLKDSISSSKKYKCKYIIVFSANVYINICVCIIFVNDVNLYTNIYVYM